MEINMKVTNSISSIPHPQAFPITQKSQKLGQSQDSLSKDLKSSDSKGCCSTLLNAISSLLSNILKCLSCIFCCKVTKKETAEDASSIERLPSSKVENKPSEKTKTKPEIKPIEKESKPEIPATKKNDVTSPVVPKPTPKVVDYSKAKKELKELVNTAPRHPRGVGTDLANSAIYEKAQNILVTIKDPQARYEAYILFVDSLVKPTLEKLSTKKPQHPDARLAANDALTVFSFLIQIQKNCLKFTPEDKLQIKGGFSTVDPQGYLPTRLNIQFLDSIFKDWRVHKDKYFDDLESHITTFLCSKEVSGWNQRSTFYKIFQENLVDFR